MAYEIEDKDTRPTLIPKYWSDKDVLERAKDFVKQQLERALPDHKSREQKWLLWDQVYRLIDTQKPTDGGCNIVDPEPQIIVDVMKANYVEAFFSEDPSFEYKGQEGTDDDQAEIMTAYRADHLRRINLREKFERSIHQYCVFGTAVCKDPWRKEVTKRVVREKIPVRDEQGNPTFDAKGRPKLKVQQKTVAFPKWDDTDWEYVSLFDFFWVGKGSDVQELEGVMHRVRVNWDKLKSSERKTEKVDGNEVTTGIYSNLDSLTPTSAEDFDLIEYWGRIPKWVLTGKDEDKYITWEGVISAVIDVDTTWEAVQKSAHAEKTGEITEFKTNPPVGEAAIRCQENPFIHGERPFRLCPHTPVEDELLGIGMIEPIVDKWHELNTTIRQLVDNKTLMLLNPTIEDANANVQREVKLIKFPRIKADDVNAVQPLRINDFSANGWQVIQALKDDIRRGSGALETIQGIPMKDERVSATEFQGSYQAAGVRIKNRIRMLDEKLYKKFLVHVAQFDITLF